MYKEVYVNVLAFPAEITEPPSDAATVDGQTITLHCRVFGAPKPLVRWIRDGEELTGGRYRVMESGDLQINNVSFVDAGTYTCMAQNRLCSAEKSAGLVVREHTRIQDAPEDYEGAAENRAKFRCSAIADPSLRLTIHWLRDGAPIDLEAGRRYVKLEDNLSREGLDSSLIIERATDSDSGIYTCLARTELDSVTVNATLVVHG